MHPMNATTTTKGRGPSAATKRAIKRVLLDGLTAYAAAKAEGIHPGTLYRSPYYRKAVADKR